MIFIRARPLSITHVATSHLTLAHLLCRPTQVPLTHSSPSSLLHLVGAPCCPPPIPSSTLSIPMHTHVHLLWTCTTTFDPTIQPPNLPLWHPSTGPQGC